MQSIDEDPSKKFFLLTDNLTASSVELRTRQCFRFMISNKDELEIFLTGNVEQAVEPQTGVPEQIAKNIIHVIYQDDIQEAYTRITNAVGNKAHLFLVPVKHKLEIINVELEKRRALVDGGLETCLELVVDKHTTLYRDLLTLLRSHNPLEQLQDMHKTFIVHKTFIRTKV
jgi:hypothetical protein